MNVVASYTGTTNRNEEVFAVFAPPTNPQQFLWDANGCLTNDGYAVYSWDDENRLKEIETCSSYAGLERRKSQFVYDAMGRRVQSTNFTGWTGSAYATTNVSTFVYDGWNLILEMSSGVTNRYVWGLDLAQSLQGAGGIGGLLCVIRNGTPYFPVVDGNGNITEYVDQTGAVVAHREYGPFGHTVSSTGPLKDAFNFWFSTKCFEDDWNLYYYGRRFYSPSLGRWLNRDPIEEQGGVNLYGFVEGNAISAIDPLGEKKKQDGGQHLVYELVEKNGVEYVKIAVEAGAMSRSAKKSVQEALTKSLEAGRSAVRQASKTGGITKFPLGLGDKLGNHLKLVGDVVEIPKSEFIGVGVSSALDIYSYIKWAAGGSGSAVKLLAEYETAQSRFANAQKKLASDCQDVCDTAAAFITAVPQAGLGVIAEFYRKYCYLTCCNLPVMP